ncbi:hypothetical protein [Micromonospora echinospora]|uniref:hypothetical protein n=1 Tax=Micromonospora echinospora TaxID=1877 RepID=UPI003A8BEB1F
MLRAVGGELAHPSRPAGPFAALVQLASSGALPAPAGPEDPLGGYRPILRTLLRDLAQPHGVRYAALWLPAETAGTGAPPWTPAVAWRSRRWVRGALPIPAVDPDQLLGVPGVVATADVTDGGTRSGVLVLAHPEDPRYSLAGAASLGETAVCVGLLLRQARHRAACASVRARVDRAVQRVGATRLELLTVQAVERDRLATAVTATPGRQLQAILDRTTDLERALRAGSPQATEIVGGIRAGLGEMIEQFRSVVRGVYPQVLRSTGVRAALEEVTATLPVPVVFSGELGRRQGWEVESGLYQAGASAAAALGASGGEQPVTLELGRSGGVLTIRAQRAGTEPAEVATALRDDSRRLAALGGRLRVERDGPDAPTVVDILLPERLGGDWPEPARAAEPPSADADAAAPELLAGVPVRRLLTLLVTSREALTDSPPLRVAVERQDGRARVVVVGASASELVAALCEPAGTPGRSHRPGCPRRPATSTSRTRGSRWTRLAGHRRGGRSDCPTGPAPRGRVRRPGWTGSWSRAPWTRCAGCGCCTTATTSTPTSRPGCAAGRELPTGPPTRSCWCCPGRPARRSRSSWPPCGRRTGKVSPRWWSARCPPPRRPERRSNWGRCATRS